MDELRESTKNLVLRRLKSDILDLPEKIITPVILELKSTSYDDELEEMLTIKSDDFGTLWVSWSMEEDVIDKQVNKKVS